MTQLEYWKQRCEAAEATIDDADIRFGTNGHFEDWQKIKNMKEPTPEAVGEADPRIAMLEEMKEWADGAKDLGETGDEIKYSLNDFLTDCDLWIEKCQQKPLTGSRWHGEQGQHYTLSRQSDDPDVVLNTEYGATPHPCGGARWVRGKYDDWCKETKRNGKILVGSMQDFFDYLEIDKNSLQP